MTAAPADRDRDHLAAVLGAHYVAGRLDIEQLDRRLGVALSAQTAEEASAALDGLPAVAEPAAAPRSSRGRHGEHPAAQPGWLPTLERFRDPTTSRLMRVWIDPADTSRHYVAEPG